MVTSLKEKVGRKVNAWPILMVEDLAGSVEVLVFGEVYDRAAPWLQQPSLPLWLKGAVIQEEQGPKLRAPEIAPRQTALAQWPERLDLRVQAASVTPEQLLKLKEVLGRHPGPVPAFQHFLGPREEAVLALPLDLSLRPPPSWQRKSTACWRIWPSASNTRLTSKIEVYPGATSRRWPLIASRSPGG